VSTADRFGAAALLLATAACVALVPSLSLSHLDEPAYWGILGYFATLGLIVRYRAAGGRAAFTEKRLLVIFLAGMPLVYIASWWRHGGGGGALALELAGWLLYGAIALAAAVRPAWVLAAGITGHGLWDLLHYGRADFIPDWYTLACFAVDVGVAIYVVGRRDAWRRTEAPATRV
jgi:hypothetical protein